VLRSPRPRPRRPSGGHRSATAIVDHRSRRRCPRGSLPARLRQRGRLQRPRCRHRDRRNEPSPQSQPRRAPPIEPRRPHRPRHQPHRERVGGCSVATRQRQG
jgi:hypothetical protein